MLLFIICEAPKIISAIFGPFLTIFSIFHLQFHIFHVQSCILVWSDPSCGSQDHYCSLNIEKCIILIPFPNLWDIVYRRSILNKYCYHYPTSVTASWWGPKAFLSDSVFKQLKFNFTTSFCCYFATFVYVAAFVQVTLLLAHLSIKSAQRAVRRNPPTKHIITYLKHFTKGN